MEKQFSTFSVIPTEIIINKEISSTSKLLYAVISSLTNEKGYCWASNKYLGDLIDISERHASRSINNLLKEELIKVDIKDNSKRKITLVNIIVGKTKMSRGVDKNVVGDRQKCRTNNIIEKDNNNILLADKSAIDKEPINKGENNIISKGELCARMGLPNPTRRVEKWQDDASIVIKEMKVPEEKISSVFKCFRDNSREALFALRDCKDNGKMNILYFFKVYYSILKQQKDNKK